MELCVEVKTGPQAGKKLILQPGKVIQVGRTSWADLSFPRDPTMSGMHFAIECGSRECRLRDLKSTNGTLVNGVRVTEYELGEGDLIVAGQTSFLIRNPGGPSTAPTLPTVELESAPATSTAASGPADLLQVLHKTPEPLFALVDAARDPRGVLTFLQTCKEEYQSLYEGPQGEQLAAAAPYLVRLPPESPALGALVQQGWGNSWGVYLSCGQSFPEVRKHLRRFLLVKLETGQEVYFRFYDPRVLRVFLPTCTPPQATEFFGPVSRYLVEAEDPTTLLTLTRSSRGTLRTDVTVAVSH
jgi:hypothetical protein